MQDSERGAFSAVMQAMAENFGQTLKAEGLALRFEALREFGLGDVKKAAMCLIRNRKYTTMPTVADFIEYLGGGSVDDKAEVEAGKVLEAIERVGAYRSIAFDNPVTQAVIEHTFGGWVQMCRENTVAERKWWRREFVRSYAAYARQGVQLTGYLPGIAETSNEANGFAHREKYYLVGNAAKALEIANTVQKNSVNSICSVDNLPYDKRERLAISEDIEAYV